MSVIYAFMPQSHSHKSHNQPAVSLYISPSPASLLPLFLSPSPSLSPSLYIFVWLSISISHRCMSEGEGWRETENDRAPEATANCASLQQTFCVCVWVCVGPVFRTALVRTETDILVCSLHSSLALAQRAPPVCHFVKASFSAQEILNWMCTQTSISPSPFPLWTIPCHSSFSYSRCVCLLACLFAFVALSFSHAPSRVYVRGLWPRFVGLNWGFVCSSLVADCPLSEQLSEHSMQRASSAGRGQRSEGSRERG